MSGIPQGKVLCPLLLVVYPNDMPGVIQYIIKLLADATNSHVLQPYQMSCDDSLSVSQTREHHTCDYCMRCHRLPCTAPGL